MILVVTEQHDGRLNRASWEAVAAAQELSGGEPVELVVLGAAVSAPAGELAQASVRRVHTIEQAALDPYTPDGYVQALHAAISSLQPDYVLLPHTYRTRDFAPRLAARLDRALVPDCTAVRRAGSGPATFLRPMFQGRLEAEVLPEGGAPYLVTTQVGAFSAGAVARATTPAPVTPLAIGVDAGAIRQRPEARFREAREAIDLSQAERVVAVGRGIRAPEHVALAARLATALGAQVGASRPVCDAGWVTLDRQVGSSGQTVAPKLYVALGISGAIQHLVGMKGAGTIVAVNLDGAAPIFEIADYGIAGDLFDVVPALIAELERA